MPRNGLNGGQFRQFGCRIFIKFVAKMTALSSHGTPFTADTLRRFSSAAMPYADIPARLSSLTVRLEIHDAPASWSRPLAIRHHETMDVLE